MSKVCQITGKKAMVGNHVSHANNKTKRLFKVNLMTKRFYMPDSEKWITLKISNHGLRTINKLGIEEAVQRAKKAGYVKL